MKVSEKQRTILVYNQASDRHSGYEKERHDEKAN